MKYGSHNWSYHFYHQIWWHHTSDKWPNDIVPLWLSSLAIKTHCFYKKLKSYKHLYFDTNKRKFALCRVLKYKRWQIKREVIFMTLQRQTNLKKEVLSAWAACCFVHQRMVYDGRDGKNVMNCKTWKPSRWGFNQ